MSCDLCTRSCYGVERVGTEGERRKEKTAKKEGGRGKRETGGRREEERAGVED